MSRVVIYPQTVYWSVNRTTSTTAPTVSPTAAMYSMASALTSRDPNTPTNPRSSTANPTMASSSTRVTEDNTSSRPTHLAESSDASTVWCNWHCFAYFNCSFSEFLCFRFVLVSFLGRKSRKICCQVNPTYMYIVGNCIHYVYKEIHENLCYIIHKTHATVHQTQGIYI